MTRAAVYARVSTEEQTEERFSVETQLADIERYCRRQDDQVTKEYVDIQSGTDAKRDRANFEQMLVDARAGLFDKIVVWRPDRLFRGLSPAAKVSRVLDETGIEIEGVLQPLDRKMVGLWAWMAEQELETMQQRFRAGKRARAEKLGKWNGGSLKYGYQYNQDIGELELNETEAEVVRGMFDWVAKGKTATSWCRWANEQRIATKLPSKGWTQQLVSTMLRDTLYTGKGAYGKTRVRGSKTVKAADAVSFQYPQIVSEKLFAEVRARLAENIKFSRGSAKHFYMLQHLGSCGECGGPLGCRTLRPNIQYIVCQRQRLYPHDHKCFERIYTPMVPLEESIWAEVEDLLDNYVDSTLDRFAAECESVEASRDTTIAKAQKELGRCDQERERVVNLVRKGHITDSEAAPQLEDIRKDRERWQEELARAEASKANVSSALEGIFRQIGKVLETRNWWWEPTIGFTPEQKREIFTALLDEFVLYQDGRIELRLKVPTNEAQVVDTIVTASRDVSTPYGLDGHETAGGNVWWHPQDRYRPG